MKTKMIKNIIIRDQKSRCSLTMDFATHFLTENEVRRLVIALNEWLTSKDLSKRYGN